MNMRNHLKLPNFRMWPLKLKGSSPRARYLFIEIQFMLQSLHHNIIQSHNNVLRDWQYSVEYFHIQTDCEESSTE